MAGNEPEQTDTRTRILQEAEKLFAEKGFDSTGIEEIAVAVGISKSVIYYHFKNKEDILQTMITTLTGEIEKFMVKNVREYFEQPVEIPERSQLSHNMFHQIFAFLRHRRNIIKIVLMESLKESKEEPFLFQFLNTNFAIRKKLLEGKHDVSLLEKEKENFLLESFFMGFMPAICFIIMADKWSNYYQTDKDETEDKFINLLNEFSTHFAKRYFTPE